MTLSEEGVKEYRQVIKVVHAYISLFTSSSSVVEGTESETIPAYLWEELYTLAEMGFRFSEKFSPESYATSLAETLAKPYARSDVLAGPALVYQKEWSPQLESNVREFVRTWLSPEKARVTLMMKDGWESVRVGDDNTLLFQEAGKEQEWEKEKWYGTEHAVRQTNLSLDDAKVEGLHFPKRNELIPTRFDVEKKEVAEVRVICF